MNYWMDLIWVGNSLYPRWLVYVVFVVIGLMFGVVAHFLVKLTG